MAVRPYKKRSGELVPGVWVIDYRPEGRDGPRKQLQFPEDGTTCSHAEALSFEAECRRLNVRHCAKKLINPSIESIIPDFLEWHKMHRAESTHRDVLYSLKSLMPIFGPLPVSRITPGDIFRFKASKTCKNRTINKELHYLSGIISWMVKNDHADPLPFKIEQLPATRPLPNPPTPEEAERLLAEIHDPMKKALFLMMYQVGCRWSEAAGLLWERVNFDEGVCTVHGKGDRWRMLPLPPLVRETLEPHAKTSGPVFVNEKTGKPYGSLKTLFHLACKRAGLRYIHPHDLRHAAATDMLTTTGDLRLVQQLLGHKVVTTTQIYTQVSIQRIQNAQTATEAYRTERKKNGAARRGV